MRRPGTPFALKLFVAQRHNATEENKGINIMDSSKMKIVYVITERGGRNFWNRCGVAFVNSDGSLNVKLEAIPVNGEVHIRDYVPREEPAGISARNGHSNVEYEARSA